MMGGLVYKSQKALASAKPFIIRINDVGHAEAIDYRNFDYRLQEAEDKYYLTRWVNLYFGRNRYTLERDQTQALYFLNSDVQRAVIEDERKTNLISNYLKDSTLPYVDVEVKNVILDDLRQSPYSIRIEFDKAFTNPGDQSIIKREKWTATVTYVFNPQVLNEKTRLTHSASQSSDSAPTRRSSIRTIPSHTEHHDVASHCHPGWYARTVAVAAGVSKPHQQATRQDCRSSPCRPVAEGGDAGRVEGCRRVRDED